jgi:hypothetical protein
MAELASQLSSYLGRDVVDPTGLTEPLRDQLVVRAGRFEVAEAMPLGIPRRQFLRHFKSGLG